MYIVIIYRLDENINIKSCDIKCVVWVEAKSSTNRTAGSGRVVSCEKSCFQEGDIALNFKKGDGGSMANAATQRLSGGSAEKRTGNAIPSCYVSMSQSFSKQANNL